MGCFIFYNVAVTRFGFTVSILDMITYTNKIIRYVAVEGMCTMIVDLNPKYWYKNNLRRPLFVAFSCFVCFLAALPMVTRGGMYVFQVSHSTFYNASGFTEFI